MKRIKYLRKENDEKQIDLAQALGVAQSMLSNWERGIHRPPDDIIFEIADRYGVSTDYLMGYSDSREFTEPEPLRLLREYLLVRTGREFSTTQLVRLDHIFIDISGLY